MDKLQVRIIGNDSEFCSESCRELPEITTLHEHDGVQCDAPGWFHKHNGIVQPKKPILDVCDKCNKPTRKQTIIINWITSTKEKYR
jgi:hypothetical protein